jgi:ATP-dependent RNA helicase DHX57
MRRSTKALRALQPSREEVEARLAALGPACPAPVASLLRELARRPRTFFDMQRQRRQLPAHSFSARVVRLARSNRVVIIKGATGCGKTTQVPQFLLDASLRRVLTGETPPAGLANIVVTQPRRLSAVGVAQRVAAERGEPVGRSVGYQIRMEAQRSAATRLLFCTTGILLRRLEGDPALEVLICCCCFRRCC